MRPLSPRAPAIPGVAPRRKADIAIRNDFGSLGYGGPCPPKGAPHHYVFTVYALDIAELDADENASATAVVRLLRLHTLAKAALTGFFGR